MTTKVNISIEKRRAIESPENNEEGPEKDGERSSQDRKSVRIVSLQFLFSQPDTRFCQCKYF